MSADHDYRQGGTKVKYLMFRPDGSALPPEACYFVLRLDQDPHARAGAMAYALSVRRENPQLAEELIQCVDAIDDGGAPHWTHGESAVSYSSLLAELSAAPQRVRALQLQAHEDAKLISKHLERISELESEVAAYQRTCRSLSQSIDGQESNRRINIRKIDDLERTVEAQRNFILTCAESPESGDQFFDSRLLEQLRSCQQEHATGKTESTVSRTGDNDSLTELQRWSADAAHLLDQINLPEIGSVLGLKVGDSIADKILPAIKRVSALERQVTVARATIDQQNRSYQELDLLLLESIAETKSIRAELEHKLAAFQAFSDTAQDLAAEARGNVRDLDPEAWERRVTNLLDTLTFTSFKEIGKQSSGAADKRSDSDEKLAPVYSYRRRGLGGDFVTCSKDRYAELSNNPLFEVKTFYADHSPSVVNELQREVERYKRAYGYECDIRAKRGKMLLERDKHIAALVELVNTALSALKEPLGHQLSEWVLSAREVLSGAVLTPEKLDTHCPDSNGTDIQSGVNAQIEIAEKDKRIAELEHALATMEEARKIDNSLVKRQAETIAELERQLAAKDAHYKSLEEHAKEQRAEELAVRIDEACEPLRLKLAAQQAWLDKISRLGSEPHVGNSRGNIMALNALNGDATELNRLLSEVRRPEVTVVPVITRMVDRFLGWRLPQNFYPDGYISFDREKAVENNGWPFGTNLFDAAQARQMFEHALSVDVANAVTTHENSCKTQCGFYHHCPTRDGVIDSCQDLVPVSPGQEREDD